MPKKSRDKGARVERQLVTLLRERFPDAEVERTGKAYEKGADVSINGKTIEVKARANGFKSMYKWLEKDSADYLVLKADRKPFLVVMRLEDYLGNA